jgi:hypothetical protein
MNFERRQLGCVAGLRLGSSDVEQRAHPGEVRGAGTIGEEAVMADAVQPLGKRMHQEAPEELMRGQDHGGIAALPVILDREGVRVSAARQAQIGCLYADGGLR